MLGFFLNGCLARQWVLSKKKIKKTPLFNFKFSFKLNRKKNKYVTNTPLFILNNLNLLLYKNIFYKNFKNHNSFLLSANFNSLRLQIIKKKKAQHLFSILVSPILSNLSYPLTIVSGSNIASFLKLSKKNKSSPLTQMLACFFIRKYILLLYLFKFDLFLKNMVCTFSIFWRYIKTPSNNIYWNPITSSWVFDVKLLKKEIPLLMQSEKLSNWLDFSGWYFLSKDQVNQMSWDKFKRDLFFLNLKKINKWVFRYTLNWSEVQLQSAIQFGFKKTPKLKRLPRRHTKRIVNKFQTRFWVW